MNLPKNGYHFTINLTQDQQAIVDERDWRRLSEHKWYAHWDHSTKSFYAARQSPKVNGKQHTILMHRIIMGLSREDRRQVDHINHDTLDNRRENLRICTNRENHENRRDQSKYGAGVWKEERWNLEKPYYARAWIDGKTKYIGWFATSEEAQEARKKFLEEKLQEVST